MMRRIITQFCLLGIILSAPPAFGRDSFPEQKQLALLKEKYEHEFKTQLATKPIEERSLSEIYAIALHASQKAYGEHPELMRQKVLHDLEQIPHFKAKQLNSYELAQSYNLLEIFKTKSHSKIGKTQADILAVFYGRKPEAIAQTFKNMILAKTWSAKQFGQWSAVSRFLPDKTYQMKNGKISQLIIRSYNNDLFVFKFDVTETGLIKPLTMDWMKPGLSRS